MIPIELDKTRNINYPLKSIRSGKKQFSKGLVSMMSFENMGPDACVDLLWIGLIHEEPGLTVSQLDQIVWEWLQVEGNNFGVLEKAVLDALKESKALNFTGAAEKNLKIG